MITWTCDRCGATHSSNSGIVGNEYKHEMTTLGHAYRRNGVVDLCKPCFNDFAAACEASAKAAAAAKNAAVDKYWGDPKCCTTKVIAKKRPWWKFWSR